MNLLLCKLPGIAKKSKWARNVALGLLSLLPFAARAESPATYTPGLTLVGSNEFRATGWYTSTSNGKIMLVADASGGCTFISVTNKLAPYTITNIEGAGYSYGTECYGDTFFVSTADGRLQVFDTSVQDNPVRTEEINAGIFGKLQIYDGLLFAVGGTGGHGVVDIYSLQDPAHPLRLSRFSEFAGYGIGDVAKKGDYLYVANYFNRSIDVLEVSNPAAPVLVDTQKAVDHGDPYGFEPWKAHVKGNALYIMDDGYWQIFDLADPAKPAFVKSLYAATDIEGGNLVGDIYVWGASGIHSNEEAGIYLFNCVDEFNPVFLNKAEIEWVGGFYFKCDERYIYYSRTGRDISIYTMPQLVSTALATVALECSETGDTVVVNGSADRIYLIQESSDLCTWRDCGLVQGGFPYVITNKSDKVFYRSLTQ